MYIFYVYLSAVSGFDVNSSRKSKTQCAWWERQKQPISRDWYKINIVLQIAFRRCEFWTFFLNIFKFQHTPTNWSANSPAATLLSLVMFSSCRSIIYGVVCDIYNIGASNNFLFFSITYNILTTPTPRIILITFQTVNS